jgi:glycosyltransferase involved in cell wall biosynthesis
MCVLRQTISTDQIEWFILDNSDEGNSGWEAAKECSDIKIHYRRIPPGKPIGALRNELIEWAIQESKATYYAWWDDDDYYIPTRLEISRKALEREGTQIAMCREMYVFLSKENFLMKVGPYPPNNGTCASFFVTRKYLEKNRFPQDAKRGEEEVFCRGWTSRATDLNPKDILLVLGHPKNTVNKSQIYDEQRKFVATQINMDNAKNVVRFQWIKTPEVWDLFRRTYLAEEVRP